MTIPYLTGTVSIPAGSKTVTGTGTAWATALIVGGVFFCNGLAVPIASIDGDRQLTLALGWPGAAVNAASYAIMRDTDYARQSVANATTLSEVLAELRAGMLFQYDASGPLAKRATYDEKPEGFSYLVTSHVPATLYIKASSANADWTGPFRYAQGEQGVMGPAGFVTFRGTYNPAADYERNDGVYFNGSSYVALKATRNIPPPGLPGTANANWSLMAVKGENGAGTGDMKAAVYDPQSKNTDAFNRANHTGTQPISTVADLQPTLKDLNTSLGRLASALGGAKNLLLNASFLVNQLGVSGTVYLGAGAYGHDGWKAGSSGCSYTVVQSGGLMLVDIHSGTLLQIVEGVNVLGASTYVLSWQGTAKGRIATGAYGTSGVTAVLPGATDVAVEFGTGTLALVQLEKGSVATAFDNRGYDVELMRSRRYYFDGQYYGFGQRDASMSNGQLAVPFTFPVQMRTSPAVTTGANFGVIEGEGQAHLFPQAGFSFSRVTAFGGILTGYAPPGYGTTANVPWRTQIRVIASARM